MDESKTIGYCIIETPKGGIEVGCWTEEDSRTGNIEPSNFFPEYKTVAELVIQMLNDRCYSNQ